jgi:hypothetical protein
MEPLSAGRALAREPDVVDFWREARVRLDEELARRIPELFRGLPGTHLDAIQSTMRGGKRLRGCLVCLVNAALGGAQEAALPRAVAIECIQAASLIHDDYVDRDTVRRNRPATWVAEGARRAVLLGDLIFATAIQRMVELGHGDGEVAAEAIATMARGAYLELAGAGESNAGARFGPDQYERIIYLKTGALFGAAAKLGALAAGAPAETAEAAFRFGARLGELYQIADDLEDLAVLEPPRLAGLVPALLHFGRDAGLAGLSGDDGQLGTRIAAARPALERRMRAEIAARAALAERELDHFAPNAYTRMLRTAPHAIANDQITDKSDQRR